MMLGQWLQHEGPRAVGAALLGKLAIPWMTLTGIGTGALWFITAGRGWDIPGHLAWICLALALLMALSLAAGAAVAALTKSLRTALSVTGLLTAPAFAFSGMSFPLSAMPDSARLWATSMPFTHYIRLQTEQLLMGLPARVSEREQSGRIVYRVRLGPFDKKDDADKVKVRLDTGGLEATLVRVQK